MCGEPVEVSVCGPVEAWLSLPSWQCALEVYVLHTEIRLVLVSWEGK